MNHLPHLHLLCSDLLVGLDVDVVVGRKAVNLVGGELGAVVKQSATSTEASREIRNVREALDKLELGGDLSTLLGDLLLGAAPGVSID